MDEDNHYDDGKGKDKVQKNNASDIINSIGQNQNKYAYNKDDYAKELKEQMIAIASRKKKEKELQDKEDLKILR